tara:strand:+ start:146 stop:718 length:573 start_codon:yes stop_codon:yes gene_type:complete
MNWKKEGMKEINKILSDKNSTPLEYTYKGKTKNGIPHTLREIGIKDKFKLPKTFKGDYYDLDFLKSLKGEKALFFFYHIGTRCYEKGQYINGKLEGPTYIEFGSPHEGNLDHHEFVCNFKKGSPHGYGFINDQSETRDTDYVVSFNNGQLDNIIKIDEWDKYVEWGNYFKYNDKILWKILEYYFHTYLTG